jgi:hypothetical protein
MTRSLHSELRSFYNICVRRICRRSYWVSTKCQNIFSWTLRQKIGIGSLDDYYVKGLLGWAGHSGSYTSWLRTVKQALVSVGETESTWMRKAANLQACLKLLKSSKKRSFQRKTSTLLPSSQLNLK